MLVAILCVCGWLTVPVGDSVLTMQTFGVFLTLYQLGGRRGTGTIIVYLLLGAVGLPVFSGFRGGLGMLLGATGGYLLGFFCHGTDLLGCGGNFRWAWSCDRDVPWTAGVLRLRQRLVSADVYGKKRVDRGNCEMCCTVFGAGFNKTISGSIPGKKAS
jgi:hypothetical protein